MRQFLRDQSGASAAEYALLLAAICVGLLLSLFALSSAVQGGLNAAALKIASAGSEGDPAGGSGDPAVEPAVVAAAVSPGQSGGSHGRSDGAPGRNGSAPGLAGATPGFGAANPAFSGVTPGRARPAHR